MYKTHQRRKLIPNLKNLSLVLFATNVPNFLLLFATGADGEKLTRDIGSLKTLCRQNLHQGCNTGTHTLPVHSCATMYRLLQDILHWQGLCLNGWIRAMIAFSNIFNLLNMIRCIASGRCIASLEGACTHLQNSPICHSSQQSRSASNSKKCTNCFTSWWCAWSIAATRTPGSSCKIACAAGWRIS